MIFLNIFLEKTLKKKSIITCILRAYLTLFLENTFNIKKKKKLDI